jgi:aspartate-semialdehyde dehydrogenase
VKVNIAIVGAGGAVGHQLVELLEERDFPVGRLLLMATARSAGQSLSFRGRPYAIQAVSVDLFEGIDLAFFAVPSDVSRAMVPEAVKRGAVAIDKSNAYREDPAIPLVVPEVNPEALDGHQGIIAVPNCSTIQLVLPLKAIDQLSRLRRIVVSTYQSVSGTGRDAIEELRQQTAEVLEERPVQPRVYPHQIAFNLLPHIDDFVENGYTKEEMKMVNETRKILGRPDLPLSATTVRVPVEVGHSEAVWVETEDEVSPEEARRAMEQMPGVVVEDDPRRAVYPLPIRAAGRDEVFVGRIRRDLSTDRGLVFWVVADNLRKGAATTALQVAERLLERGLPR